MPKAEPPKLPLIGDPSREAVDSMRGYSYQVLCSVLAWVELSDGEVLYLEGAEDFDHITTHGAITTQVKDTSRSLTLRSSGALRAIDNYWSHRERNPGQKIRFRYLTTSEVGTERDDPFGRGIPGIDLWQRAKKSDERERQAADVAALRAFLITQDLFSESLKQFLANCSDEDLLNDLIQPIDWDAAADGAAAVLAKIRDRLVTFGYARQVPTRDAEAVVTALYSEAWAVATRDHDRRLDRAAFIRTFDENTRVSLPKAQLTALVARLVPLGDSAEPLPTVIGDQRAIQPPPPLPCRYYGREAALAQAAIAASCGPIVILQGSTGTSKTTTAVAFSLQHGGTWGWLELRGHDIESTQRRLTEALREASAGLAPLHIAIDDLDASTN